MTRTNDDFAQGIGGTSSYPVYVGENGSTGVLHQTFASVVNGKLHGGAPSCSNSPRSKNLYRVREYDPVTDAKYTKCKKCFPTG